MMWGYGWGWGWLVGMLMMVAFWGGLIALVVWLVRSGAGSRGAARPPEHGPGLPRAEDVLAERFARGEISQEEFEERRRILRS